MFPKLPLRGGISKDLERNMLVVWWLLVSEFAELVFEMWK